MGFIIFLIVATLLMIFTVLSLWVSIDKNYINHNVLAIVVTLISFGILIGTWISVFIPMTPYTNEENISRYEALIDKVEDIDENTPATEIEKIYNEVAEWNEEYTEYQSNIGGFRSTKYPADRYIGCDEINFWEVVW
jgi:hypothetical protein